MISGILNTALLNSVQAGFERYFGSSAPFYLSCEYSEKCMAKNVMKGICDDMQFAQFVQTLIETDSGMFCSEEPSVLKGTEKHGIYSPCKKKIIMIFKSLLLSLSLLLILL